MRSSSQQARAELAERLRERRGEIEQAAIARVKAIANPDDAADPSYVEGLRAAIVAALDHGIVAVESGDERESPIPLALLAQARSAARNEVSLDTVLRRYFAGYTLLADFVFEEAEGVAEMGSSDLKRLLRTQAAHFDRLVAMLAEEYVRESRLQPDSGEEYRIERVRRLLDGEFLDMSEFGYSLEGWHLGMLATGRDVTAFLRCIASHLDRIVLVVQPEPDIAWAWLGGRRPFKLETLLAALATTQDSQHRLSIGEPGEGLTGWRLTHHQAAAALPVAKRSADPVVRYADVALLASVLQDDLLATSLRQMFLAPFERERDGGEMLRRTLRAYFAADRNVSSAAAALDVKRHTVTNRLRIVENCLGRSLDKCTADLEIALRLEGLGDLG